MTDDVTELRVLRANIARASKELRRNPVDESARRHLKAARDEYAIVKAASKVVHALDGLTLTPAGRRRVADAVMTS